MSRPSKNIHSHLDRVGFLASFTCIIHCIATPLILAISPIIGLAVFANEKVEILFISTSGLLAVSSLCWGVRKHKKFSPLAIAAGGFALIVIGHLMDEHSFLHVSGSVGAGACICISHMINYKLCLGCRTCQH